MRPTGGYSQAVSKDIRTRKPAPGAARQPALIGPLLASAPPKAAAFIVTIYGDVVEPRGGVLWMGNLIDTCAAVGINESLVRTAVSRLVAAGQLAGERAGRRSYYRLTPQARTEFSYAAGILYESREQNAWQLLYLAGADPEATLRRLTRLGYAAVNPRLVIGPGDAPVLPGEALVWEAAVVQGQEAVRAFAAQYWDLPAYAQAYHTFIARFEPVLAAADQLDAALALALRLLLVHQYRGVVLRAPRLPAHALPPDWAGHEAQRLFASLYLALSRHADRHVAERFIDADGVLPEQSAILAQRLAHLRRMR